MPSNPIIFDGHNDTLLSLFAGRSEEARTFFVQSDDGHIDLPRARAGGLGGGFFAIFVPNRYRKGHPSPRHMRTPEGERWTLPHPVEQPYALDFTVRLASGLFRLEEEAQGDVKVVRSAVELERCLQNGTFAAILHAEGAEFVDPGLGALEIMVKAGMRSLGLVWSRPNLFGNGVPFNFPDSPDTGDGLTELGKQLVRRCNQLRVMVDLSHLNEKGFWDVAAITDAPLVATHSNAHALSASPRNLTDRQLDAVRESGGVVGVNFHKGFLRADGVADRKTSVLEIARHAAYMAERMGIDHVALGSDFDGARMPDDLADAAGLPRLMDALRAVGFDDGALAKIAHGNWLRVLRLVWGA